MAIQAIQIFNPFCLGWMFDPLDQVGNSVHYHYDQQQAGRVRNWIVGTQLTKKGKRAQALVVLDCLEGLCGEAWRHYMEVAVNPQNQLSVPLCFPEPLIRQIGDPVLEAAIRSKRVRSRRHHY